MHDGRLRTVATALQRRLQTSGLAEVYLDASAPSSSQPPQPRMNFDGQMMHEENLDPEEWVRTYVTGKGLDVIIDEVKKRTGVSPFLRGKHSSLDPFGTANVEADGEASSGKAVVYMPTFQAEKYVHEVAAEVDPMALSGMIGSKRVGKRKASLSSPPRTESEEVEDGWPSIASDGSAEDAMSFKTSSSSRMHSASPPLFGSPHELSMNHQQFQLQHAAPHPHPSSTNFELPVSHSRMQYMDGSIPPQPTPSRATPHIHTVKKRRLAPAPSDSIPRNLAADPLRIYHNHLQTG